MRQYEHVALAHNPILHARKDQAHGTGSLR